MRRRVDYPNIGTFLAWRDAGFPRGVGDLVAPPSNATLGDPDLVIAADLFELHGGDGDRYLNVELPHEFEDDSWVVAVGVHTAVPEYCTTR